MIVTIFVIFLIIRDINNKRRKIFDRRATEKLDERNSKNSATETVTGDTKDFNTSLDELCMSYQSSETLYSSATSRAYMYDKRRQDSSSICSEILNDDAKFIEDLIRMPNRKSISRSRKYVSKSNLTRRRRTTGRYRK